MTQPRTIICLIFFSTLFNWCAILSHYVEIGLMFELNANVMVGTGCVTVDTDNCHHHVTNITLMLANYLFLLNIKNNESLD